MMFNTNTYYQSWNGYTASSNNHQSPLCIFGQPSEQFNDKEQLRYSKGEYRHT